MEIIKNNVAAYILHIKEQGLRNQMAAGKLPIGLVVRSKKSNRCRVYTSRLAAYLECTPERVQELVKEAEEAMAKACSGKEKKRR